MFDFEDDILNSLKVLRDGGLILYPTDTIWGIGCDATNEKAVERIYALKKRSDEISMIVLVAGERDILKYVAQPDLRIFDYLEQAKKPTTIIYEGAIGLASNLISADGTIGIRICKEEFCKHLLRRFRKPVVSSSANISGRPAPKTFAEIESEIKNGADHVVRYRQDDITPGFPSSIIKWNRNGTITTIR
jgi:L-threonylcarbamoyladenylate synthase